MKILQGAILILVGTICMAFIATTIKSTEIRKDLPVSLPEELSLVKQGDTLYVTEVTDSIYIGFRK